MIYKPKRMKFGVFLAPFHRVGENPNLAIDRDIELIVNLDRLGFDEAWIGEHHSAGWELIADPTLVIVAAAQRTRSIMLGTGVTSLPYHHPLMVAGRMVQLDHMTRGRAMLGVGPGALSSDAYMMGIDSVTQRERMNESLEAIMLLLAGDAPVTMETDWFTLRDARLQMPNYTHPHLPIAVAHSFSPAGPRAAGRFGIGMLSVATAQPGGMVSMQEAWSWAEEAAAESGRTVSREDWRIVIPFHLAESKQEALDAASEGAHAFNYDYFEETLGRPGGTDDGSLAAIAERGGAIIGTPDDAIEAIEAIQEISGGFGGVMGLAHEWANGEATLRSYELWARYVAPRFQGMIEPVETSREWVAQHRADIFGPRTAAITKAFEDGGQELPEEMKQQIAERAKRER